MKDTCQKTVNSHSLFSQTNLKTGAFLHNPEAVSRGPKFVRVNKTAFIVFVLENE